LEEKARIVAESLDPATTSSAVARRYGLQLTELERRVRENLARIPEKLRLVLLRDQAA
jgi:transposase-like protein